MPFALGLVAIFSFDAADMFFISRLGEAPLAAVAFALPLIWLTYGIGIGLEAGAASCVSRAVGRGEAERSRRLTTDTLMLAAAIGFALTLAGITTIDAVFSLLGATSELLPLAHDYMGIWYWVVPLDMVLWTTLASIRARGNTALEAKVITAAAVLNLVLDPILIFGWLGAPELGIKGAALATVLSNAVMLLFTLFYLNAKLRVFTSLLAPPEIILASWRHVMHIGLPAMVSNAIIPISSAIVVAMVAAFGIDAVAGFGVAMRIEPIFLIPFYALSAVASPFFGQNSGADRFDRLIEARRVITRFCLVFGLALAVTLVLVAKPLTGLYSSHAPIQDVAVHYLWLAAFSYGAYGLVMSVNAAFNGMGQPMPGVILSACRVIVVFLPLAWLGRHLFGLDGLFAATLLSNLLVGAAGYTWLGRRIGGARARA
ncbi:MAG: MATE family efflux transporter [Xanthomonadales bacterium]|nr:MATE family efflux transporter [Gammaproteobacteria bacterium]MBT8051796.1 MATE family efflux transporter [Gammaproteobacteria bacterium]MBT8055372.1 MATE family efflux transporter [Gammaproteobacteria bacterium]NNJ79760.1 MATE family efflux transporter [Xanthomonadales bacterium]NNL04858.1 MATE family efflux transporter [Xanthomonadales bacterium]